MCNLTAWQRALEKQRRERTDAMRVRQGKPPYAWAASLERRNAAQTTEKA